MSACEDRSPCVSHGHRRVRKPARGSAHLRGRRLGEGAGRYRRDVELEKKKGEEEGETLET